MKYDKDELIKELQAEELRHIHAALMKYGAHPDGWRYAADDSRKHYTGLWAMWGEYEDNDA